MKVQFRHKYAEASDVWSFVFEPMEPFTWTAGQSIRIEVPGSYGPIEHRFTIASAPYEKHIIITTRLSQTPFKKSLHAMEPGTELDVHGLDGDFIWEETTLRRVFVATGVGITPFHSILKQRVHEGQQIPVTLIYGSPFDDIPYKETFDTWEKEHPEFSVRYIVGRHVTAGLIAQYVPDFSETLVYVSGPSAMVDDVSAELQTHYQVPEERLRRDWFTGRLSRDG